MGSLSRRHRTEELVSTGRPRVTRPPMHTIILKSNAIVIEASYSRNLCAIR